MKIEVNIEKKHLAYVITLLGVIVGVGYVIAFGSVPSPVGHAISELQTCDSDNQILKMSGGNWICGSDQTADSGSGIACVDVPGCENDPQVSSTTNEKWCKGTGSQVNCAYDAPDVGGTATNLICNACVDGYDINQGVVSGLNIKDNDITTTDIKDETITSDDIKDGTITSSEIMDNRIESADIKDWTINTVDIANGAITGSKMADVYIYQDWVYCTNVYIPKDGNVYYCPSTTVAVGFAISSGDYNYLRCCKARLAW